MRCFPSPRAGTPLDDLRLAARSGRGRDGSRRARGRQSSNSRASRSEPAPGRIRRMPARRRRPLAQMAPNGFSPRASAWLRRAGRSLCCARIRVTPAHSAGNQPEEGPDPADSFARSGKCPPFPGLAMATAKITPAMPLPRNPHIIILPSCLRPRRSASFSHPARCRNRRPLAHDIGGSRTGGLRQRVVTLAVDYRWQDNSAPARKSPEPPPEGPSRSWGGPAIDLGASGRWEIP